MADIIVTTPKEEIITSREEGKSIEKSGGYWFRVFKYKINVSKGDKIYFVENGAINGYGTIFHISKLKKPMLCEITKRKWGNPGNTIVKYKNWQWLKKPVPFKGFQNIRYVDRINGLRELLK